MRPPDFRSILQSDNASSGPGASLDSGGNGLGGFGADAGMNLKPPNFQMQTDTSSALNAGAAIPSLSQQNDFASGPALKPLHSADEVPESIGGFGEQAAGGVGGGGLSRERRMRPPDFRSILQSDNASSGPSEPVPFGNQGNDGGLVLKPLGSLNGGGNGLGGFGADAGMNLKPPNFQMQTDTSSALNAGAAIPSLSQQNDFASGPALKPLHSADEVPESIGGFGEQAAGGVGGGGLSRERRMRPPDFRSILQSDNASSGPSEPVPFGNQRNDGGLALKPLGSLNGGGNGLGGFGADAGMNLKPSNFQMQTDTSSALNAGAAIPSLSQQNDFASGPALKPLHSADEVPESIGGFGEQAAGGVGGGGLSRERRMRPPDFRSILQSDNASSGPSEPVPFGNQGNDGGLVLKPLGSLNGGGNGLGGLGADAGMNLKPSNFQMQTDTSSALNAGAAIPSLSQQNDFASGPALKPLHSADEVPESIGGFGEQAAGGVGGGGLSRERRMRPPDFRSILQSDNASSGPSEPVPFGNQGNDGGLVLKPLGSLNGGGNGLGGFGADAGMDLKPSNFQMQTDTSSAPNAGAAIPSLSQQNDFASGPALKPLHSADEVPESIGGFGSDFAGPGAIKSTAGRLDFSFDPP